MVLKKKSNRKIKVKSKRKNNKKLYRKIKRKSNKKLYRKSKKKIYGGGLEDFQKEAIRIKIRRKLKLEKELNNIKDENLIFLRNIIDDYDYDKDTINLILETLKVVIDTYDDDDDDEVNVFLKTLNNIIIKFKSESGEVRSFLETVNEIIENFPYELNLYCLQQNILTESVKEITLEQAISFCFANYDKISKIDRIINYITIKTIEKETVENNLKLIEDLNKDIYININDEIPLPLPSNQDVEDEEEVEEEEVEEVEEVEEEEVKEEVEEKAVPDATDVDSEAVLGAAADDEAEEGDGNGEAGSKWKSAKKIITQVRITNKWEEYTELLKNKKDCLTKVIIKLVPQIDEETETTLKDKINKTFLKIEETKNIDGILKYLSEEINKKNKLNKLKGGSYNDLTRKKLADDINNALGDFKSSEGNGGVWDIGGGGEGVFWIAIIGLGLIVSFYTLYLGWAKIDKYYIKKKIKKYITTKQEVPIELEDDDTEEENMSFFSQIGRKLKKLILSTTPDDIINLLSKYIIRLQFRFIGLTLQPFSKSREDRIFKLLQFFHYGLQLDSVSPREFIRLNHLKKKLNHLKADSYTYTYYRYHNNTFLEYKIILSYVIRNGKKKKAINFQKPTNVTDITSIKLCRNNINRICPYEKIKVLEFKNKKITIEAINKFNTNFNVTYELDFKTNWSGFGKSDTNIHKYGFYAKKIKKKK